MLNFQSITIHAAQEEDLTKNNSYQLQLFDLMSDGDRMQIIEYPQISMINILKSVLTFC